MLRLKWLLALLSDRGTRLSNCGTICNPSEQDSLALLMSYCDKWFGDDGRTFCNRV